MAAEGMAHRQQPGGTLFQLPRPALAQGGREPAATRPCLQVGAQVRHELDHVLRYAHALERLGLACADLVARQAHGRRQRCAAAP